MGWWGSIRPAFHPRPMPQSAEAGISHSLHTGARSLICRSPYRSLVWTPGPSHSLARLSWSLRHMYLERILLLFLETCVKPSGDIC